MRLNAYSKLIRERFITDETITKINQMPETYRRYFDPATSTEAEIKEMSGTYAARFKDRFIDIVLSYGNKKYQGYPKAYLSVARSYAAVKILNFLGLLDASYEICKRILLKSDRYQIYFCAADISMTMARYLINRNKKKQGQYYFLKYDRYTIIYEYEQKVIRDYYRLGGQAANTSISWAKDSLNNYRQLCGKICSHRFDSHFYLFEIEYHLRRNQYLDCLKTSIEAYNHFKFTNTINVGQQRLFINQAIKFAILTEQWDVTLDLLPEALELVEDKNQHWMRLGMSQVKTYLNLDMFEEAVESYGIYTNHKFYKQESEEVKKDWLILGYYIHIVAFAKRIESIKLKSLRQIEFAQKKNKSFTELDITHFTALQALYMYVKERDLIYIEKLDYLRKNVRTALNKPAHLLLKSFIIHVLALRYRHFDMSRYNRAMLRIEELNKNHDAESKLYQFMEFNQLLKISLK